VAKEESYAVIPEEKADPEFRGYFNASVQALPGYSSYGATQEEASTNMREAILWHLENLGIRRDPFSDDVIPELKNELLLPFTVTE
jgi:predicted RNase H-like HicB family nuclease